MLTAHYSLFCDLLMHYVSSMIVGPKGIDAVGIIETTKNERCRS